MNCIRNMEKNMKETTSLFLFILNGAHIVFMIITLFSLSLSFITWHYDAELARLLIISIVISYAICKINSRGFINDKNTRN